MPITNVVNFILGLDQTHDDINNVSSMCFDKCDLNGSADDVTKPPRTRSSISENRKSQPLLSDAVVINLFNLGQPSPSCLQIETDVPDPATTTTTGFNTGWDTQADIFSQKEDHLTLPQSDVA